MTVSTHVLDAVAGQPAAGVPVTLARRLADAQSAAAAGGWQEAESARTDADGRYRFATDTRPGVYRLVFATGAYFAGRSAETFYPEVTVTFTVSADRPHVHVPLLLSPYSYSTYRGS